jgi:plasmid stability protein
MSQLTVRKVGETIVAALKRRAAKRRYSAEAEHRAILKAPLGESTADFWKDAAQLRGELVGRHSDSGAVLRVERDRRSGAATKQSTASQGRAFSPCLKRWLPLS